jgi:hypothetical protein
MNFGPRLDNLLVRFEEFQERGTPLRAWNASSSCPELRRRIDALGSMDVRPLVSPFNL